MRTPSLDRPPVSIWFKLLIPAGFLFCATALSWVMTGLDRSGAPVVQWINRYAICAILAEAGIIVFLALIAMVLDSRTPSGSPNDGPISASDSR